MKNYYYYYYFIIIIIIIYIFFFLNVCAPDVIVQLDIKSEKYYFNIKASKRIINLVNLLFLSKH